MKLFSGNGRHAKKKSSSAVIALALIICLAIGGTVAYITTSTEPVENVFTPGDVTVVIEETVKNNEKTSIMVRNTGKTEAYIRIRLVTYMEDVEGNPTAEQAPDLEFNNTSAWVQIGNYYYCKQPVADYDLTPEFLESGSKIVLAKNQVVYVLAEGIQSTPDEAVTEAWGVTVENGQIVNKGAEA